MNNDNLFDAKKQASNSGLNVLKLDALLQEIETNLIQRPLSEKYKVIFYLAATGLYSAEDLAEMFNHNSKNLNSDFNRNLGVYLRLGLELDDDERVGITSLRRVLLKKGYFVDMSDDSGLRKLFSQRPDFADITNDSDNLELDNLEAFERYSQDVDSRLSELNIDKDRLNNQLRINELKERRQRLEEQLKSAEFADALITSAEEDDHLIDSLEERFCRLYQQLMTQKVGTTIDVLDDVVDILIEIIGVTLPPVKLGLLAIGIIRKLADGYCRKFTTEDNG
jgi:hypothetical protein